MEDLTMTEEINNLELETINYDEEPVYYCKRCLSLKIMGARGIDFCDECTSADIGLANIHDWDVMFFERYGYHYLNTY